MLGDSNDHVIAQLRRPACCLFISQNKLTLDNIKKDISQKIIFFQTLLDAEIHFNFYQFFNEY